jgi:hypothetical protein
MPVQNVTPSGNWQDPAAWSSGAVPTAADAVLVTGATITGAMGAARSITLLASSLQVTDSLAVSGDISIYGGTLAIASGALSASDIRGGSISNQGGGPIQANIQNASVSLNGGGAIVGSLDNVSLTIDGGNVELNGTETGGSAITLSSYPYGPVNLVIDHPQSVAPISGMQAGDTLDLKGVSTASATYDGSTLNITETGGQILSLAIQGQLTGDPLSVTSDGFGGSLVTWLVPSNGSKPGASGDWSDPAQWVDGHSPPAGADVVLNGATLTSAQPLSVGSLVLNDSVLTVQAGLMAAGSIQMFGGSINASRGPVGATLISGGSLTLMGGASVGHTSNVLIDNVQGPNLLAGVTNHATIRISAGSLEIAGPLIASQEIFDRTGVTLKFDDPSAAGPITGMLAGDVIDLAGVSVTAASYDRATLTLQKAGGGTLAITLSGALFGDQVQTASDGQGGTNVFWTPPASSIITGTSNTLWSDGATWTGGIPGGANDNVVLNASQGILAASPLTLKSLTLNASSLDAEAPLSVSGDLRLTPGASLYSLSNLNLNVSGNVYGGGGSIQALSLNASGNFYDTQFSLHTGKITGSLHNSTVDIASGNFNVEISGPQSGQSYIQIGGNLGTLVLDTPQSVAPIYGVLPGMVLDLAGISASSASFDGITLKVLETGGQTLSLLVESPIPNLVAHVGPDGSGGTAVSWSLPPPPAPTALADAAIHNGYVNAAADVASQTLTGKAPGNTVVAVIDAAVGAVLGATNVDGSGNWSVILGHLADGPHQIYAFATDGTTVSSPSTPLAFTVDTVAPIPEVLYVNKTGSSFTLLGYSEPGKLVKVFDNGTQITAPTADSRGVWSVTLTLNPNSAHHFTEQATDAAGNVGVSTGQTLFSPNAATLAGGAGDDVLIAWGNETVTGGAGHDRFVVDTVFTHRAITDFTPGADVIELNASAYHDFAYVTGHAQQSGANTVITVNGEVLTLQNVNLSSLHASDFLFL